MLLEYLFWEKVSKMPLMNLVRVGVYVFLSIFGGGELVYDLALGPFLCSNEDRIDKGIEKGWEYTSLFLRKVFTNLKNWVFKKFTEFIALSLQSNPRSSTG